MIQYRNLKLVASLPNGRVISRSYSTPLGMSFHERCVLAQGMLTAFPQAEHKVSGEYLESNLR